jgi:S-adenosylmethionine:tRNA ribosyltransferase-isomerase
MKTSDFDYHLPPELIAQIPVEPRDRSRLMVLNRYHSAIEHRYFYEIVDYLHSGDTLVLNNSRVIPARLLGRKSDCDTKVEILLLRRLENNVWETLVRPSKKIVVGTKIRIVVASNSTDVEMNAEVLEHGEDSIRLIRFSDESLFGKVGRVPLPPYIHTPLTDAERYQTVYAETDGSVAAPTAGLHFTPRLLNELQQKGIQLAYVTMHIGLYTFRPVRVDDPCHHKIHKEYGDLSHNAAAMINYAKQHGNRIIAVGTSTARLLEAASQSSKIQPFSGWVDLFILPGYKFRVIDAMITNFHLPRSTLLMLVSAFADTDFMLNAYQEAKSFDYRFYSFGDAMLIL